MVRFTTLNGESTVENHPPSKPSEYDQVAGNHLQRFYVRAIVGILGPLAVCAYFIAIWRLYLVPAQEDGPITFGLRGAKWIFYSWFVAGVLGLGLSLYGLTGIEAAMLMESTWNVGNATRLMLHADSTWSGPGGWLKTLKWALLPGKGRRSPPCLWYMLALPSILIFIAWPLSGLTMETTQGYRRPDVTSPASLAGFSYDTFNERGSGEAFLSAEVVWRSRAEARIPGVGIVYTPEGFDRSQTAFLNKLPVVLPRNEGVPPLFLVPQAETPVEGNHWGLLLHYNCIIIDQAQDFQLLSEFNRSQSRYSRLKAFDGQRANAYHETKGTTGLTVINNTEGSGYDNLDAVAEYAAKFWPSKELASKDPGQLSDHCYFKNNETLTGDYPGIHEEQIFEMALWQALQNQTYFNSSVRYNFSIDHNITDYYDEYNVKGFRRRRVMDSSLSMTAIGVQCRASSSVGRADINGIKSSYSNFQRTDTRLPTDSERGAYRFDASSAAEIFGKSSMDIPWTVALFQSASALSPVYGNAKPTLETGERVDVDWLLQPGYLQAEELRQSMLSAYASYAVQLMYNGGQPFTTSNGSTLSFIDPNVTSFQTDSVIKPGVVPAVVPLGLFCVWALVSSALGLIYGFRRRWTETLDGHTLFRMGAELSEHARRELLKTSNIGKKDDDKALSDIPGLVGDTKPEMWLGRIGLVASGKAGKKKLYE